jgi:hypothetical protein
MITERQVIGMISVLEWGQFQVRIDTIVERDGVEIARTYFRTTFEPGDDVSNQHEWVRAIANLLWTDEVIKTRKIEFERLTKLDPFLPPVDPNSIK